VVTVRPNERANDVLHVMLDESTVVDGDVLVSICTRTDLLKLAGISASSSAPSKASQA
jgi:hypothetical protein